MKDKHILIIDDHDSIRLILGNLLHKSYTVITKKDGIEALAWFNQGHIPDLILLDMQMPRLSGLDFLSNIRSSGLYRDIPVVIISGNESQDYIAQCDKLQVSGYLKKPFSPTTLHEQISSILFPLTTLNE